MDQYLDFAKDLAVEAGKLMLVHFHEGVEHHYKEDKTIVTIADEEINQMVIDRVAAKFPDHSVLGEEASNDKKAEFAWVVDPIDGTNPYAMGLPVSTFSLALCQNGQPIVGVINDPFTKNLYWAVKGGGAFMNGQKLAVSGSELKPGTRMNVDGWASAKYDTWHIAASLSKKTGVYPLSIGSVVRASTLVASGKIEAAIFPGREGKFVDIAAAKIIVEEAGGKVTCMHGQDQRYDQDIDGAVISNGKCHQQVLDAIKENK